MRVEVAYPGRIEVFDTDRFTEAQPFAGKSMLADLALDHADVERRGLWLTAHCYAANDAYMNRNAALNSQRTNAPIPLKIAFIISVSFHPGALFFL